MKFTAETRRRGEDAFQLCPPRLRVWWRMYAGYGNAIRSYAFSERSSRRTAQDLDSLYLDKCETEIEQWGTQVQRWSEQNAYGSSLADDTIDYWSPGWYFSPAWGFDVAVGDRITPSAAKTEAVIENLNYEAGRNPVNVSYVTGLGWTPRREIVHQYARYDQRILPPSGIPQGNMAHRFIEPEPYQELLNSAYYPANGEGKTSYALYDRGGDAWSVMTEFVHFQSARALAGAALLAADTPLASQLWRSADPDPVIDFPGGNPTLTTPGVARLTAKVNNVPLDLSEARIVWEVEGDEPSFGQTASVGRSTPGTLQVEAEGVLPDGRRVFASKSVLFNDPNGGSEFTPDANTIALYHFDSIVGNLFQDFSLSGAHHLTISGNVTLTDNTAWMQTSPPGANAVRFHNIGDELRVTIPYQEVYPSSGTTLAIDFRIYPRAYKGDGQTLLGLYQLGQSDARWRVFYPNSWDFPGLPHRPQVEAPYQSQSQNGVMLNYVNWDDLVPLNTWHHFRITLDSAGVSEVFINDMVSHVGTSTVPPPARAQEWILSLGNFDGDIDELKISH